MLLTAHKFVATVVFMILAVYGFAASSLRDSIVGIWTLEKTTIQKLGDQTLDTGIIQINNGDLQISRNPKIISINFLSSDSFSCPEPLLKIDMGARHFSGTKGIWNIDTTGHTLLLSFSKNIQLLFLIKRVDQENMELIYVGQNSFSDAAYKFNDHIVTYFFRKS